MSSDDGLNERHSASTERPIAIFLRFLRFGLLAWGGPVAQIAMIKRELVEEQHWISPSKFNRLLAVYQVLPGPEAHELCVHFGMLKGQRLGGFLAGLGFMLPGFILILLVAAFYQRLDLSDPLVATLFLGVQIGVIALIIRAIHRIADHTLMSPALWAIAIVSALSTLAGVSFWITLPLAGIAAAIAASPMPQRQRLALAAGVLVILAIVIGWAPRDVSSGSSTLTRGAPASIMALFLSGLKAGLLTFGGAYTAIPFVRDDAVGRGWISESQFLDGLALSGIIPAPLIIFATFVGYLAGGLSGALAMTAGIFLPAFAFGMAFYDQLERVIEQQRLLHFLEGVAAGVVGLIVVTAGELAVKVGRAVPSQIPALLIFSVALAALYRWKSKLVVPAVVLGSAIAGGLLFSDHFGWLSAFSIRHDG